MEVVKPLPISPVKKQQKEEEEEEEEEPRIPVRADNRVSSISIEFVSNDDPPPVTPPLPTELLLLVLELLELLRPVVSDTDRLNARLDDVLPSGFFRFGVKDDENESEEEESGSLVACKVNACGGAAAADANAVAVARRGVERAGTGPISSPLLSAAAAAAAPETEAARLAANRCARAPRYEEFGVAGPIRGEFGGETAGLASLMSSSDVTH